MSSTQRTFSPVEVRVFAISLTMAACVSKGWPRQFCEMKENRRCSILFHLLVPGGRWHTEIVRPLAVGKALQLPFPQSQSCTVAPAAVGGDQQALSASGKPRGPIPATSGESSPRRTAPCRDRCRRSPSRRCAPARTPRTEWLCPSLGPGSRERSLVPDCPCGRHWRPPFLKRPTNSFFLVSTEITGDPRAIRRLTSALMYSNCAFRSGWLAPSIVLRLACRLYSISCSRSATNTWLTEYPFGSVPAPKSACSSSSTATAIPDRLGSPAPPAAPTLCPAWDPQRPCVSALRPAVESDSHPMANPLAVPSGRARPCCAPPRSPVTPRQYRHAPVRVLPSLPTIALFVRSASATRLGTSLRSPQQHPPFNHSMTRGTSQVISLQTLRSCQYLT